MLDKSYKLLRFILSASKVESKRIRHCYMSHILVFSEPSQRSFILAIVPFLMNTKGIERQPKCSLQLGIAQVLDENTAIFNRHNMIIKGATIG